MIKAIRKKWLIFKTRIIQKIAIALERRGIIPHDPIEERLYAEAMEPIGGFRDWRRQ